MPGEKASCVGCHERPSDDARRRGPTWPPREPPVGDRAVVRPAARFRLRARGAAGARQVLRRLPRRAAGETTAGRSPICVRRGCDRTTRIAAVAPRRQPAGSGVAVAGEKFAPCRREHELLGDRKMRYTPAYDALSPLIRRVNMEDHVGLHVPGEYHADTSELMQMLAEGAPRRQARRRGLGPARHVDRSQRAVPRHVGRGGADPRRGRPPAPRTGAEVRRAEGRSRGRAGDSAAADCGNRSSARAAASRAAGSRRPAGRSTRPRPSGGSATGGALGRRRIDLGDGVTLRLVRIPAGEFLMGDGDGEPTNPRCVAWPSAATSG